MRKKGTSLLIVLLAVVALMLSGCSGGTKPASENGSAGSTEKSQGREPSSADSGTNRKLVIAEPVHLIGYLPLYLAQREGYFKEKGLDVEVITATGGAHVTSVVSGEAWGVIGGPESNAMANKGSSDPIVSVVNVVNRANVYLMAKKGMEPEGDSPEQLKAFLKGKTIAAGRHGGTPNLLTRWLLLELGLDPEKDVRLEEPADAAAVVSMVQQGAADIANGAEPQISEGVSKGVWGEPFYKFPQLGDYSYSVISVKKSTIEKEPEIVQAFVEAIVKALKKVQEDKELARKTLKAEFPTLSEGAIQAALDRAYEDQLWSPDGMISEEALKRDMDVVIKTGIFKGEYSYDQLVDMQFVNHINQK
ncbi:ABC transporter substrate-binding protein [Anoxybacillus geothermalis]|nr:ABC transporter substrate-binding protein [Anoxybacillus geothermalis]